MLTLVELIAGRPWAIRADIAAQIHGLVSRDGIAGLRHLAELKESIHASDASMAARGRGRGRNRGGAVAVIPVIGPLTQRREIVGSSATRSTMDITAELQEALADPNVDAAVLDFDTPGGEVFGVPEAWHSIRQAAKVKPVVASVNSMAASAGYYLASAADEIFLTPSGVVGSVGVYALHVDASKALEDMGEAWEFVVAKDSPFKVEGHPGGPLTEEARGALQEDIDRYMGMFVRDLAKGRKVSREVVRRDFGQGRVVGPEKASAAGMVDQVGTLEEAVQRAGQLGFERREGAAPAADLTVPAPVAAVPDDPEVAPAPEPEGPSPEELAQRQEASRKLWGAV